METEITLSTILEAVDGVKTLVENSEKTDLSEVLKELDNIETDLYNIDTSFSEVETCVSEINESVNIIEGYMMLSFVLLCISIMSTVIVKTFFTGW